MLNAKRFRNVALVFVAGAMTLASGCHLFDRSRGSVSDEIEKLTVSDVEEFYRSNIDGKGFRNSMHLDEMLGVQQNGNEAKVYYRWSGINGRMGEKVTRALHIDSCVKMNDGRWLLTIRNDRIDVSAFLEK